MVGGGSRDIGAHQHRGRCRESGHRSARRVPEPPGREQGCRGTPAPGPLEGGSTGTSSGDPCYRGKGNGGGNPSHRGERRRIGQEIDRGLEADWGRYDATEVGHGGGGGRAQRRQPTGVVEENSART